LPASAFDVIVTFADGTRLRQTIGQAMDLSNAAYYLGNQETFIDPARQDKVYYRSGLVAVEAAPAEDAPAD